MTFSTTSCLRLLLSPTGLAPQLNLTSCLDWVYIIVERPLNRLLYLWNSMFDRHQAEITVMQFRGHSLLAHQSMSVSWAFLPCPISSAKSAHWNVSLPSGASLWMAYLAGSNVKIQHTQWMNFWVNKHTHEHTYTHTHAHRHARALTYKICVCVCISEREKENGRERGRERERETERERERD